MPREKPDDMNAIPSNLTRRRAEAGERIFAEGDVGEFCYLIESGDVELSKRIGERDVRIAALTRGDLFGEMALLDNSTRSATATALTEASLAIIPRHMFMPRFSRADPVVRRLLLRLVHTVRTLTKEKADWLAEAE